MNPTIVIAGPTPITVLPAYIWLPKFLGRVALPMVGLNAVCLSWWLVNPSVARENGPMENLQALALIVGSACLFRCARGAARGPRVFLIGLSLFYLTFFVREMDLTDYDVPALNAVFRGWIRKLWLGVLWTISAIWFLKHRKEAWRAFLQWIRSPGALLLILAGLLWGGASAVERLHLIRPRSVCIFVEEAIEMNAAWLMLASAVVTRRAYRRSRSVPRTPCGEKNSDRQGGPASQREDAATE